VRTAKGREKGREGGKEGGREGGRTPTSSEGVADEAILVHLLQMRHSLAGILIEKSGWESVRR